MDILAQHGFGPKDKLSTSLDRAIIQGAILSPRYARQDKIQEIIREVQGHGGRVHLDPELFAAERGHMQKVPIAQGGEGIIQRQTTPRPDKLSASESDKV
ncbi:MAG: hypothetical protein ACP5I4_15885, partial [Oceanipulchritudo sp.]